MILANFVTLTNIFYRGLYKDRRNKLNECKVHVSRQSVRITLASRIFSDRLRTDG